MSFSRCSWVPHSRLQKSRIAATKSLLLVGEGEVHRGAESRPILRVGRGVHLGRGRGGRERGGLAVRASHLEDGRAHLEGVALAQAAGVLDALAVYEGAVARPEVLDDGCLALDAQRGVAAGDRLVGQLEVGALVAADGDGAVDGVLGSGAGTVLHYEPDSGHLAGGCVAGAHQARSRTRTGDPLLTMEVLYQLSYPAASDHSSDVRRGAGRLKECAV